MATPSSVQPPAPPPLSAVEHVRRLAETGRGDAELDGWSQLLRPPLVKISPRRVGSDFGADNAWLRAPREAFLDRWVALRDGQLLDSDTTLRALMDRLTASGQVDGAFIVRVD
jgi:hypothetical protein